MHGDLYAWPSQRMSILTSISTEYKLMAPEDDQWANNIVVYSFQLRLLDVVD